ncbi:MAG: fatty acid desaturase [Candidatus Omnitrophica bacterium]|nr:fatty acid desaturase [Candidatus Omnitrophota bacterium]
MSTAVLEAPAEVRTEPIEPSAITPRLKLKWDILLGIAAIHAGLVFAPFTFNWSAFRVFIVLQAVTALGITLCFHRLLTHRSFQVPKWLEYALTLCGTLALQGGVIKWVATHRVHHAFSDRPQDPHSPKRGFWWAHVFWLFAYDDVLDHETKCWAYAPDLARDKVHMFLHRTHVLWTVILGLLLFAWGGWPFVVWGIFVRTAFVYHGTWLVNSAAHIWGYQSYDTNEGSRNNWWVALVSYGEGWHNNHHAYPSSAAHGLRWWEVDVTYAVIRLLWLAGLATEIRLPRGNPAKLPAIDLSRLAKLRWAAPNLARRARLTLPNPVRIAS